MGIDGQREGDARRFVENLEELLTRSPAPTGEWIPLPDSIDGTDSSGTVYCVVDMGGRLSQVGILDGWWTAVGTRGVAPAVLDALRFARDKAGLARMMVRRYGRSFPETDADYSMLFTSEPPRELPPYDAPDFDDALRRKLDRAATILANAERLVRQRDSGLRREVTGPRGLFRVVLSGATVMGASVNDHALRPDSATELAADALDALHAATPYARTAIK